MFVAEPRKEQERLLIECCERVNKVLESVRLLSGFLNHSGRGKSQRAARKNPHKDVMAALLRDVEGLSHHKIAKTARIDRPGSSRGERDYSKVRQTIDRGRDILKRAYGSEGYATMVESMKAELRKSQG
jgi:hypothetical protein